MDTLRLIEEARPRGVDATIDAYPYTASSTGTAALFSQWSLAGGQNALLERLSAPDQRAKTTAEIIQRIRIDRGGGAARKAGATADDALVLAIDKSAQGSGER